MIESAPSRVKLFAFLVIAMVACSMLMYEILLTRISALRLLFHFSFLVISNCLLGVGAAGTAVTLYQSRWGKQPRVYIWRACLLFLASIGISYAFLLSFALPSQLSLSDPAHFFRFSIFNLVATVPFFMAGVVIGMVLTFYSQQVNRLYAADLFGASIGCLFCPLLLESFGAGGTILVIGLLALAATLFAAPAEWRRLALITGIPIAALAIFCVPSLDHWFPVPTKEYAGITPEQRVRLNDTIEYSKWSAGSRIDLHTIFEENTGIFGSGRNAKDIAIPEQKFINQDGSAGTYITNFSEHPEALEALRRSLYFAALSIKDQPRVFVIGVGGGHDIWAAKTAGARQIKGIELNRPIIDIHRTRMKHFSRAFIDDPTIEIVHGEGRSMLKVESDEYDIVQMTGIDTWTSLASGAYVLAENYLYTREAIQDMYERLAPGGILQITRFSFDMELLRLLATIDSALDGRTEAPLWDSVICLHAEGLASILVKKGAFAPNEIRRALNFVRKAGVDIIYLPQLGEQTHQPAENLATQFITSDQKELFIRQFPRNISPTTDDRPYFFNYTKWSSPVEAGNFVAEPTAVSQGNPFFLLVQLGVSALLAVGLIVLPIARTGRVSRDYAGRFLIYFAGLGAGFIAIEIALIQKLTLFLGHPIYSITVTLFCMLIFAGLGSLCSGHWFEKDLRKVWILPAGVAAAIGSFLLIFPMVLDAGIGWPLAGRVLATALALAPTAFLLGVPFALGIRVLTRLNPTLIPWAWAVNGAFSVVGSLLTVVGSMNLGFTAVLLGSIGVYAVAFAALPRSDA